MEGAAVKAGETGRRRRRRRRPTPLNRFKKILRENRHKAAAAIAFIVSVGGAIMLFMALRSE